MQSCSQTIMQTIHKARDEHSGEEFDKGNEDKDQLQRRTRSTQHKKRVSTASHYTPQGTHQQAEPSHPPPLHAVYEHLTQIHATGATSKSRTRSTAKARGAWRARRVLKYFVALTELRLHAVGHDNVVLIWRRNIFDPTYD